MVRLFLFILSFVFALGLTPAKATTLPKKTPARTILVVSGAYEPYQDMLKATAEGLEGIDLIADGSVPMPNVQTPLINPMWQWLSANAGGKHLKFLSNGFYSYDWSEAQRKKTIGAILRRLHTKKDVDLILTMGSDASKDMFEHVHHVPVLSISSSDPVANGLILSEQDSGKDNVHAITETGRYSSQIEVFQSIFNFERIGMIYPAGKESRVGLSEIQEAAKKMDIELIVRKHKQFEDDWNLTFANVMNDIKHLVLEDKVQALYIAPFRCPPVKYTELSQFLIEHKIYSFAPVNYVQNGLLMGFSLGNTKELGAFEAEVIREVLSGKSPRSVNQIYTPQRFLVVNLVTAMRLGWHIPFALMGVISETYTTSSPQKR